MQELKMNKVLSISLAVMSFGLSGEATEIPTWAKEKAPVKINYYFGLGTSLPLGYLGEDWKHFLHGFSRMDFSVSPNLNIWAGVDYHLFKPVIHDDEDLKFKSTNIVVDLNINFGENATLLNPYFFAGAGLAITNIRIVPDKQKSYPMLEIGGGMEYKKFFVQGRYVNVLSNYKAISYIPITLGVKF